MVFVDNIAYGINMQFNPGDVTHIVSRNLWLGNTGCSGGTGVCSASYPFILSGNKGRLVVRDNYLTGAYFGALIYRGCGTNPGGFDSFFDWQNNVAIGNYSAFVPLLKT